MEKLVIAGREFNSRLFLGTGKFNNNALMAEAIKASETEMVTVAMKRIELEDKQDDLLSHIVQNPNIQLLPNTSGVRNAEEAVFAAQMARGFRNQLAQARNPPRPSLSSSRLCRDTEGYRETGKTRFRGIAILPGRPYPLQAPRRGWCCYRDATCCTYRYQQGIENEGLPADRHRAGYCSSCSRCRYRCT